MIDRDLIATTRYPANHIDLSDTMDCTGFVANILTNPFSSYTFGSALSNKNKPDTFSSTYASASSNKPKEENMADKYNYIASQLEPKKVIFNDPATIVFWKDGTKTVVKCMDGEKYNRYFGFCAALAKKVYGNNSKVTRIVDKNAHIVDGETGHMNLVKKIMKLNDAHLSSAQIAKRLNMFESVVRRTIVEEKERRYLNTFDSVMALRKKNYDCAKIAKTLSIPESTVRKMVKEGEIECKSK